MLALTRIMSAVLDRRLLYRISAGCCSIIV